MGNFPKLQSGTELTVGSHSVTILEYLSEGGFAHIYKVKIDPVENESEIACLKRVIVPDKNGLNQLRKEVDVMKVLRNSRSIVKYYDSHAERLEDGTYQVLVLMELCPNKSLLDFMNAKIKTKLAEPEIIKIMFDISLGIYEMHRLKLIHRDIKIENVLIDSKHNFKLCDFGSTSSPIPPPKDQHQFQLLSHDILYQTTPQYRSPEMIDLYRGFPIDEKSDVWALGCFLYKLCYYTTPFETNGDIAILHASFQFLPSPQFSGDLKNLIIIMLQENPMLRPNIVQVLMLVAKLLDIDFAELGVEDFYKLGPYNFHALHEYQRRMQEKLIKQQQMYYQPQPHSPAHQPANIHPAHPAHPAHPPTQPATRPSQTKSSAPPLIPAQAPSQVPPIPPQVPPVPVPPARSQVSPVPLMPHYAPPSPTSPEQKSFAGISAQNSSGSVLTDKRKSVYDDSEREEEPLSPAIDDSFGDLENLDNVEERYPSLEDILVDSKPKASEDAKDHRDHHHVKPTALPSAETGSLTKEQLDNYNYQDQTYRRDLNQYQYQQQQNIDSKSSSYHSQRSHSQPPPPRHSSHSSRSSYAPHINEGTEYEKKEAWERSHSAINKSAEKLVDDIFSDSPQAPQKTDQSVVSDIGQKQEPTEPVPTTEAYKTTSADGEITNSISYEDLINFEELSKSQSKPEDVVETDPREASKEVQTGRRFSASKFPTTSHVPTISSNNLKSGGNQQLVTQSSTGGHQPKNNGGSANPFPFKHPKHFQQITDDSSSSPPQKSANPWGEYRKGPTLSKVISNPIPMQYALSEPSTSEQPIEDFNIKTREDSIEPNLIDLEVGLDSSSSSSVTPVLRPKSSNPGKEIYSLGNNLSVLELDGKDERKGSNGESKPQFKKRISSVQNPSQFSFQEEVIDFASDDENPENGSRMNRLSIRNSLKKSRKPSSDSKRGENTTSEPKKRISFFGGNKE